MSGVDPINARMLEPDALVAAYCRGVFPMADSREGEINWYSALRRGILPLDRFHLPRRLRKSIRSRPFEITTDRAFAEVMIGCAEPRDTESDTWISQPIIDAYVRLHACGAAHSVEAWLDGRLVGGIYGVSINGAFFGESMFHRARYGGTNASKICLAYLARHLQRQGFTLFDVQFWNPHLEQFGCIEISQRAYLRRLRDALPLDTVKWEPFDAEAIHEDLMSTN